MRLTVVDTSVFVSGLLEGRSRTPPVRTVDGMLLGRFPFLLSFTLVEEYRASLLKPKVRRRHTLSEHEVDGILSLVSVNARHVDPTLFPPAPSREDDHLWALLAARPGSILVTGDKKLIRNPPAFGQVLAPGDFLALLSAEDAVHL